MPVGGDGYAAQSDVGEGFSIHQPTSESHEIALLGIWRIYVIEPAEDVADETPISALNKDKPGSTHKGYHWVYYSPVERLVLFDYRKGRGREGPGGTNGYRCA